MLLVPRFDRSVKGDGGTLKRLLPRFVACEVLDFPLQCSPSLKGFDWL